MLDYELRSEAPSVEVYRRLRVASGLSDKSEEAAILGLAGGWYAVTAYRDGEPIGMGRIIGDGGTAFQIRRHVCSAGAPGAGGR